MPSQVAARYGAGYRAATAAARWAASPEAMRLNSPPRPRRRRRPPSVQEIIAMSEDSDDGIERGALGTEFTLERIMALPKSEPPKPYVPPPRELRPLMRADRIQDDEDGLLDASAYLAEIRAIEDMQLRLKTAARRRASIQSTQLGMLQAYDESKGAREREEKVRAAKGQLARYTDPEAAALEDAYREQQRLRAGERRRLRAERSGEAARRAVSDEYGAARAALQEALEAEEAEVEAAFSAAGYYSAYSTPMSSARTHDDGNEDDEEARWRRGARHAQARALRAEQRTRAQLLHPEGHDGHHGALTALPSSERDGAAVLFERVRAPQAPSAVLPRLLASIASKDAEESLRALRELAKLVETARPAEARGVAEYLRSRGLLHEVARFVSDPRPPMHTAALRLVGELASDDFDADAALTRAAFRRLGAGGTVRIDPSQPSLFDEVVQHLFSDEYLTVLYALRAMRRLCADPAYIDAMHGAKVQRRLHELVATGDAQLGHVVMGCLVNQREAEANEAELAEGAEAREHTERLEAARKAKIAAKQQRRKRRRAGGGGGGGGGSAGSSSAGDTTDRTSSSRGAGGAFGGSSSRWARKTVEPGKQQHVRSEAGGLEMPRGVPINPLLSEALAKTRGRRSILDVDEKWAVAPPAVATAPGLPSLGDVIGSVGTVAGIVGAYAEEKAEAAAAAVVEGAVAVPEAVNEAVIASRRGNGGAEVSDVLEEAFNELVDSSRSGDGALRPYAPDRLLVSERVAERVHDLRSELHQLGGLPGLHGGFLELSQIKRGLDAIELQLEATGTVPLEVILRRGVEDAK